MYDFNVTHPTVFKYYLLLSKPSGYSWNTRQGRNRWSEGESSFTSVGKVCRDSDMFSFAIFLTLCSEIFREKQAELGPLVAKEIQVTK